MGASLDGTTGPAGGRVRAVVVYRHLLLRDLAVRLLGNAGVEVAAAIRDEDLDLAALRVVEPDVVVVDQASRWIAEGSALAVVLGESNASISRIVTIGLEGTTMVVCHRQLVAEASSSNLVAAVLGALAPAPAQALQTG